MIEIEIGFYAYNDELIEIVSIGHYPVVHYHYRQKPYKYPGIFDKNSVFHGCVRELTLEEKAELL